MFADRSIRRTRRSRGEANEDDDGVGFFDYVSTVGRGGGGGGGGDVFAVVHARRRGELISQSKIGLKIAPAAISTAIIL